MHHVIFAPRTVIGEATPVSPPGTLPSNTTIPTYNPGGSDPANLKGLKTDKKTERATVTKKIAAISETTGRNRLGCGQSDCSSRNLRRVGAAWRHSLTGYGKKGAARADNSNSRRAGPPTNWNLSEVKLLL